MLFRHEGEAPPQTTLVDLVDDAERVNPAG
jgi:hypothetical protein